jgi:hypothetical protein
MTIELSYDVADFLRHRCGDELAIAGFDDAYNLNLLGESQRPSFAVGLVWLSFARRT